MMSIVLNKVTNYNSGWGSRVGGRIPPYMISTARLNAFSI